MAFAGPEEGIPQHEGWIQAAVNTCKAWKQAAQNNPIILAFFLAFSPFILIFMIFTIPVFVVLICALGSALVCFLTVCFFFACGLPVYFFTMGYGFLFMWYVTSRIEPVAHRIQRLYVNIMAFPSDFYRGFKRGIWKAFTQYVREKFGEDALQYFN